MRPFYRICLASLLIGGSACNENNAASDSVDGGVHGDTGAVGEDATRADGGGGPVAPVPRGDWEFSPPPADPIEPPNFEPPTIDPDEPTDLPWPVSEAIPGSPTGAPPLCRTREQLRDPDASVWGDETGIYLLTSGSEEYGDDTKWLSRHRGDAWEPLFTFETRFDTEIHAAGELLIFAGPGRPTHEINRYTGAFEERDDEDAPMNSFVVQDADTDRVWVGSTGFHDGTEWHRSGRPDRDLTGVQTMWASEDTHIFAGRFGAFTFLEDGAWVQSAFPVAETVHAVSRLNGQFYAVANNVVWRTTGPDAWTRVGQLAACDTDDHRYMQTLVRIGDRLVAVTDYGIYEITEGGVENLLDLQRGDSCDRVLALRDAHHVPGLGTAMVFQRLEQGEDDAPIPNECAEYVLVWDGTELRWL